MTQPKRTWHQWLDEQIARRKSAREFAVLLGIDESKLSRWRSPYPLAPQARDLEKLAEVTRTSLPEILLMVWTVERNREEARARPQTGATGSSGAPSAKPASRVLSRQRRLGKALGLAWATALAVVAGLAAPSVTHANQTPSIGKNINDSGEIPLIRRWGGQAPPRLGRRWAFGY